MGWSARLYLMVFLGVAVAAGLGYRAVDRMWASLGCFQPPPDGHFVAYCASPQFGDYEHGAYYFGLESKAVEHLKHADVILFGTSRAQFALSTRALSAFFADRGVAHYLFGFGYNEAAAFPLALIREHGLRPKAVVILADPFFKNTSTPHIRVTARLRWRFVAEYYEFLQQRMLIQVGSWVCRRQPALCETREPVVYRSVQDGAWRPYRFNLTPQFAVGRQRLEAHTYTAAMASADVEFAERFIAATGVPRSCVVLSAPPTAGMSLDAYVRELGRLLGVRVSLPNVNDLMTFDGSHLVPESAERWSAALLEDIDKAISACASR
jgi:hypothetical protein